MARMRSTGPPWLAAASRALHTKHGPLESGGLGPKSGLRPKLGRTTLRAQPRLLAQRGLLAKRGLSARRRLGAKRGRLPRRELAPGHSRHTTAGRPAGRTPKPRFLFKIELECLRFERYVAHHLLQSGASQSSTVPARLVP